MKAAIILNGLSLRKKWFYEHALPKIQQRFAATVFETRSKHDGVALTAKACDKGFDVVISAGGDGTLHQVVNGMLRGSETAPRRPDLAVLPLGSGNDFARSLGVINNLDDLIKRVLVRQPLPINVGRVEYHDAKGALSSTYFINEVDVGMGPAVVRKVLSSGRAFGSSMAYLYAILKTFFEYECPELTVHSADWHWQEKVRTFALANGKYYGNGLCIAPEAQLNDGVLDVFACADVSVIDFILHSIPLKKGDIISHKKVTYLKTTAVQLTSAVPMEIEADGEIIGWLPASVHMTDYKLNFLI